jgi:hypothetical protein
MPLRGVADPLRGRVLAWRPSLAAFGLAVNDGAPGPREFAPPASRLRRSAKIRSFTAAYRRAAGDGSCGGTDPLRGRVLALRPSQHFGLAVNERCGWVTRIRTAAGRLTPLRSMHVYRCRRLPPSRRRRLVWRHESALRQRSRFAAEPAPSAWR